MRRHLLALLDDGDWQCNVADQAEADLVDADEVFLTNSQMGAIPVTRCGSHTWHVGPVTRDVCGILADNGIAECRL
jgi:branched-subunit amino acid aminotransferase/4-amino-4-deoxychorismate lyase